MTGCNDYFVMSKSEARNRGIEAFCVPLIVSAEELFRSNGVVRDDPSRKVGLEVRRIARFQTIRNSPRTSIQERLRACIVAMWQINRRPWYSVVYTRPPIVATYMARQPPRFARNPDNLGSLNVIHGLYPREPLRDEIMDAAVARLNRTRRRFVGRGRTYHGGLEKFEPREMESLPLHLTL